jgi:hypothetical protein
VTTTAAGIELPGGFLRISFDLMPLTLRPTGLSSPAYADQLDYKVFEDSRAIGRIAIGAGISRLRFEHGIYLLLSS